MPEPRRTKPKARASAQPASLAVLPKSPFPKEPRPELATLVEQAPEGPDWLHEIKFDGYRILACLEAGQARLSSRNGKDYTARAPGVARALEKLAAESALVDGELVSLRDDGVSDFQLLQNAFKGDNARPLVFYAFDLLYLNGHDVTALSLDERKALLRQVLSVQAKDATIRFSEHTEGNGAALFQKACGLGLEGIISKRRSAPYRATRTKDWLKIRCHKQQEFVIVGFTEPGGSRSHLGALLLAARDGERLRYSGKVGTGFSERTLAELHAQLKPLVQSRPSVDDVPAAIARGVHWVSPELVADIGFSELTQELRLRHPVFHGLREDKTVAEIGVERPKPTPKGSARPKARTRRGT
jgi:bifunctional non-homologous end joining protein LigD